MAIKNIICADAEYRISYELLNASKEDCILFLHGWGANKEIMKKTFGSSFSGFCHIYVDLPGFGGSSIAQSSDSCEISSVMKVFLQTIDKNPKMIFGHSFGGKIALLLNPATLVLLSSAGIVLPKKLSVRTKICIFKIAKFFGFGKFYRLFASKDARNMDNVMYETFKKVVNEDMSEYFKNYCGKAFVFWGKNDTATPIECAHKINSLVENSSLFVFEGDHFFFLDKAKNIETEIQKSFLA